MHYEIATLVCGLLLEHIDEHDVDHRLHKNIRTIGTDVVDYQ